MRKNNQIMETTMRAIAPVVENMLKETDGNYKITVGKFLGETFTILIVGVPNDTYRLIKKVGRYHMYITDKFVTYDTELITPTSNHAPSRWIESQFEDLDIDLDITTYYI